jgi:magnesium transporter
MGQVTWQNAFMLLKKELTVGSFNGLLLAFLLAIGAWLVYGNIMLGVVIALSTIIVHVLAAVAGYVIPVTLNKLGKDPAISSGVLLTTITDVGGFFAFLGLAAILLL